VEGWQIGDGYENSNEKNWMRAIRKYFLNEILPTYYEDKNNGSKDETEYPLIFKS
jgi:hypothetical protein